MAKTNILYNININQKAIFETFGKELDLIDSSILTYIKQNLASKFAARNKITLNGEHYYMIVYQHLIDQMPLLKIKSHDAIGKRLKKLAKLNIIKLHVSKKYGTQIYIATTSIFDSLFLPYTKTKSSVADSDESECHTDKESDHINNSISDNINKDNKKDTKKEIDDFPIKEAFNIFWEGYPRKDNKPDAKKFFLRLFNNAKDKLSLWEKIFTGLNKYITEIYLTGTDPTYIIFLLFFGSPIVKFFKVFTEHFSF